MITRRNFVKTLGIGTTGIMVGVHGLPVSGGPIEGREPKGANKLYEVPDQLVSRRYEVTIDGQPVPVYKAAAEINVVSFDLAKPVEISITAREPKYWSTGATIRPLSKRLKASISGRTATFKMSEPAMISVERSKQAWNWSPELPVDRNDPSWWQRYEYSRDTALQLLRYNIMNTEVLFIFANPPQKANEIPTGPETIRLRSGMHFRDIDLKSGQRLHLDDGAFLFGSVNVWDAQDVSISGPGCIIHDGPHAPYKDQGAMLERNWRPISINCSSNVDVSGVTCIARSRTWTIQASTSRKLSFNNVKIIAAHHTNVNGDGIDLCGSQDVRITDCFFRTCDDSIAMYETLTFKDPVNNTWGPRDYNDLIELKVSDVSVKGCVFWTTQANIVRVGFFNSNVVTDNISITDCDVIHLVEGCFFAPSSFLTIMTGPGPGLQKHSNYTIEDIRLEDHCALVGINNTKAKIRNIVFRNIQMIQPSKWPSLINCAGIDPESGIRFENVTIRGKRITSLKDLPLHLTEQSHNVTIH